MKKLLIGLSLLLLPIIGLCEDKSFAIGAFGGIVDKIASDKIEDKYATDAININLDDVIGSITKRRGYRKYNTTALTGEQSVRKLYTYKQVDGDEYIIANSSTSVFYSKGDGSFTAIISTLSTSYTCDFATAKDKVYFSNGSDNPYRWDGTTLEDITDTSISTGMVKARYIKYWNNRMFYAGVDSYRSTVYYSEVNDPTFINTFNYINVNVSDGENITGLYVWNNALYVFKSHSVWTINEVSAGNFLIRNVSKEVGCLYQDSIAEYKGFPVFLSHRGVELFDGQFNLISEPIDVQIKGLNQLVTGQNEWVQSTASDWGAGSGTNIDTTTYSGSVAFSLVQTSRDSERSWIAIAMSVDGSSVTAITSVNADPIYLSNDSGVTFTDKDISSAGGIDTAMSYDGNVRAITSYNTIYVSSDSGATWSDYDPSGGGGTYTGIAVSSDGSKMTCCDYTLGTIYTSNDYGVSWTSRSIDRLRARSVDMSSSAVMQVAVCYQGYFMLSSDSGVNWTSKDALFGENWRKVAMSSDGTIITAVETAGNIWVSSDSGTSWTERMTDVARDWYDVCMVSDGDVQYAASSSGLYVSTNTGTSWSLLASGFWVGCSVSSDGELLIAQKANSYIYTFNFSGSFTTQYLNAGSEWSGWGKLTVSDVVPTNSSIAYYYQVATTSSGLSSSALTPITNDSFIDSSVSPYIRIVSSFSITDVSAVPLIESMEISYYANALVVTSIVHKDAYWMGVATDPAKSYNNIVYRYDKNAQWTKYSNMNIGSATIYKNKLYTGSADSVGFVYEQDVAGRYVDASDETYDSYWQSKLFDMGMPLNDKLYKILYSVWGYQNSTDTPYIKYRMFNDSGAFTSNDVTYADYGVTLQKTPMTHSKRSRYLQLQAGDDSDTPFEIKGIFGLYEVLPIR